MQTNVDRITELRRAVRDHGVLEHPYLNLARRRALTREQMLRFSTEEIFVSQSFPALLAQVICRVPYHMESERHALVQNLYEEHGNGQIEQAHSRLLRNMASELGADVGEVLRRGPAPETREFIERQFAVCRERDFRGALAAIGYANEYLVLFEYPPIHACGVALGIDEGQLRFFAANVTADAGHMRGVEDVLARTCETDADWVTVRAATIEALDARQRFYDGLMRQVHDSRASVA